MVWALALHTRSAKHLEAAVGPGAHVGKLQRT